MFEFNPGDTVIVMRDYYEPGTRWPDPLKAHMGTAGKVVDSTDDTVTFTINAGSDKPGRTITLPRLDERGRALIEPPTDFSFLGERDCTDDAWNTSTFVGDHDPLFDMSSEDADRVLGILKD